MRVVFVTLMMLASGCLTTREAGRVTCTEYKPLFCWEGQEVCEVDAQGCKQCTCDKSGNAGVSGARRIPGAQPR